LHAIGWQIEKPKGDHVRLGADPGTVPPSRFAGICQDRCCSKRKVAVSPGIGFGGYGDDHVRFSLIENEHRTRQAVRGHPQHDAQGQRGMVEREIPGIHEAFEEHA
jgi:alanine-synthesizing transaminase